MPLTLVAILAILLGVAGLIYSLRTGKIPTRDDGATYRADRPAYYWWGIYIMGAFVLTGLLIGLRPLKFQTETVSPAVRSAENDSAEES
jgi:hypothetical protein